jgi:uncharacterized protein DUF4129
MEVRRLVPYIVGLIVLAFALGSLPRGSPGGSLLFRSYWLLYLIYLGPIVVLGVMLALIVLIALNWRDIGAGIGFRMAQSRRGRKRASMYSIFVWLFMWTIAIVVLMEKPGTIFNPLGTNSTATVAAIGGGDGTPSNPFQLGGFLPTISSLVQSSWFGIAFLGLLVVGGLVLIQSVRVAMKETSEMDARGFEERRIEGLEAVYGAIELVDDETVDPRSRIITCYQHMITAVSRLGVPLSPDQTARELERAINSTFVLKGSATGELTQLFEEARYSLHDISDEDAGNARKCLDSIAEELRIQLNE